MKWTLLLLILTSCGVKGAPAPRQNSAYIFNPAKEQIKSKKDKEAKKDEQAKRRSNNRTDNPL